MAATLNIAYRTFDSFDAALEKQAEVFRQDHAGYDVALHSLDLPPLHRMMFEQGGLTSGEVDVFMCVTDWLAGAAQTGGLSRLNEFIESDPPEGWPHAWPESLLGLQQDEHGGIYGLPYHDGPECFMYRTDLFENEFERGRFRSRYGYELEAPETWSQFLDIARFFNRPDEGLHGCVAAAYPDGHNSVYDFLIHLWSRGGVFLDERNRVGFHSPAGREALQWYVDLIHEHGVTQPRPWEHDSVASGIEFAGGTAAMMWNWTGFAAVANLPDVSKVPGKVRVTPIPRGDGPTGRRASLNIYWVLTIPKGSRHKDAAYAFCRSAISEEMDHALTMVGGNGCRLSTWNDPEVQSAYQYYEVIEEIHRHALTLPRIPELAELTDVLNRMVDDAVRLRKTVDDAVNDAAGEAEELLASAGYYRD